MCLDKVTVHLTDTEYNRSHACFGWKVFVRIGEDFKKFRFPYHGIGMRFSTVEQGKWLTASKTYVFTGEGPPQVYESGFHIFKTREDARAWAKALFGHSALKSAVLKVKYRRARLMGIQTASSLRGVELRAIVADEMLVPRKGI